MPLKWKSCEQSGDRSFKGGHGLHGFCVYRPGDVWISSRCRYF